jgi:hypothetical protein
MNPSDPQVLDVTHTHSALIPYLFPDARDLKTTAALFALATGPDPERTTAFALLAAPLGMEDSAYCCDIHVDTIGASPAVDILLEHLLNQARSLRAPALECLRPFAAGKLAERLMRHGFRSRMRTIRYGFSLPAALAVFRAALMAIRCTGRVPDHVERIAYSSPVHSTALSDLCQREFGLLTHGHLRALGLYPAAGYDHGLSSAYRYKADLIGAWGIGTRDDCALFDPLLIVPGWRNTWVFPYVIADSLERLVAAGITQGTAQIHGTNRKMLAVMERIGAQVLGTEDFYAYRFAGGRDKQK